jgi:hypothetical protein
MSYASNMGDIQGLELTTPVPEKLEAELVFHAVVLVVPSESAAFV